MRKSAKFGLASLWMTAKIGEYALFTCDALIASSQKEQRTRLRGFQSHQIASAFGIGVGKLAAQEVRDRRLGMLTLSGEILGERLLSPCWSMT